MWYNIGMKNQSAVVLAALALCAAHSFAAAPALAPTDLSGFGSLANSEPVEYGQLATNQFAKTMSIRFDLVQAGVALTNFPVLVKLSTAIDGFSYSDFVKANGGDLRFVDANGTLLPHEIDTWNESGVSTVWVKVPRLVKNGTITACYGFTGSGDPAPVNPKDVWDDDYVGVWHLGESAVPLKESSETSSDFTTAYGSTINFATNGIVGRDGVLPLRQRLNRADLRPDQQERRHGLVLPPGSDPGRMEPPRLYRRHDQDDFERPRRQERRF